VPLRRGGSRKDISYNIEQLMKDYEKKGKIGNIKPRNREHAHRIATAIAMRIANKARKRSKKVKKKKR